MFYTKRNYYSHLLLNKIYQFYTKKICIGKIIVKNMREINVSLLPPLSLKNTLFFNKNLLLIFGIFITFFLYENTISLCNGNEDAIENFINNLGKYSTNALWQTSKVILFYTIADSVYNIRYITANLANDFFFISWADKVNALLTFKKEGRLSETVKNLHYSPLYFDAGNFIYKSLGFKTSNISRPLINEPVVVTVPIERCTTVTKTEPVFINKHSADVQALTTSIRDLQHVMEQNNLRSSNLKTDIELREELQNISVLENYTVLTGLELRDQCISYSLGGVRRDLPAFDYPQRVEYIQFHRSKPVKIKYKTNVHDSHIIMDRNQFEQLFPTIFSVGNRLANIEYNEIRGNQSITNGYLNIYFVPAYTRSVGTFGLTHKYSLNIDNCEFREYFRQFHEVTNVMVPQISYFDKITNAFDLLQQQQQISLSEIEQEIFTLTQQIQVTYEQSLQRNNPQDESIYLPTPELDREEFALPEPVSVTTQTIGAALSIGGITLLSNPDLLLVLGYLLTNEGLIPMLHNPEVINTLLELYSQNGMEVPQLLQEAIDQAQNNSNPRVLNRSISNINLWNTDPIGKYTYIIGGCILLSGIVIGSLYIYKETKDTSALEPAFDVVDSLKEYTKFK